MGSLLAGHDACVVMPTGGGKSLCYQLPAVVSGGTAVVISPLIALMQDQAAQLAQMGIPAAVLNSTLSESEQAKVMSGARDGAYRLLYVSRNGSRAAIRWDGCSRCRLLFLQLTRRTAFPSGDMSFVRSTGS